MIAMMTTIVGMSKDKAQHHIYALKGLQEMMLSESCSEPTKSGLSEGLYRYWTWSINYLLALEYAETEKKRFKAHPGRSSIHTVPALRNSRSIR